MRSRKSIAQVVGLLLVMQLFAGFVATPSAGAQAEERIAAVELVVLRSSNGASVVPVRVTVVARRALDALLVVEAPNTNVSWEIPLGLAANSEVTQIITVPTQNSGTDSLSASVVVDGDAIAEVQIGGARAPENAVGLLGLTAPGADVQLTPSVGRASLIEIDDLGILQALDSVVASPAGLRSLDADEQARLLRWVASGRQLAIADDPGSVDTMLPAAWLGPDATVAAGTGMIRYIGTQWADNVPPGVSIAANPQVVAGWFQSSSGELLSDAGFRVPGLGIMAILLLVYLLLAGPVTFAVLTQMRKQTLAWVVLPALAVVFAIGVFGVGRVLSSGRGNGYATIVEVSPAGSALTDTVLIAKSGRQTIELPAGWGLVATGLSAVNGQVGSPVVVEPTRTTGTLRFDIDTGSGGTAILTGSTAELQDAISIGELSLTGTVLSGTVTNSSGERLDNVTVLVGARLISVGTISNDETKSFELELDVDPNTFAPELRTWNVDPRNFNGFDQGFGGPAQGSSEINDGPSNGSTWLEWRAARLDSSVPDGLVTAVGWSRDLDVSVVNGSGRTALVTYAQLPAPDGPLVPAQIRALRMLVPSFNQFGEFGDVAAAEGGAILVTQFRRPADSDSSEVALQVRNEVVEVEVWTEPDGWRSLDIPQDNGLTVAIPDDAWVDNAMTVRYSMGQFFGDPGQLETKVVAVNGRTQTVALLPFGETARRNPGFEENNGGFPGGEAAVGLETVVELDADNRFEGSSELVGTFDIWSIELLEGDRVTVRMNAGGGGFNGGQLDPFLLIRGTEGQQIAENDDFDGLNSGLDFTADVAGVYSIETRPLGGAQTGGGYTVLLEVDRAEASE